MIENKIKNINFGHTLFSNFMNIVEIIITIKLMFLGMNILGTLTDETMQLFGLIVFLMLYIRTIRFRFNTVYNSKDGGLIRYD